MKREFSGGAEETTEQKEGEGDGELILYSGHEREWGESGKTRREGTGKGGGTNEKVCGGARFVHPPVLPFESGDGRRDIRQ